MRAASFLVPILVIALGQLENKNRPIPLDETAFLGEAYANHQGGYGFSSAYWGSSAELLIIESQSALNRYIAKGNGVEHVVGLGPSLFTLKVLKALEQTTKLKGVVLLDSGDSRDLKTLSFERTCPSVAVEFYSGRPEYAKCSRVKWNDQGLNLLEQLYEFPVLLLRNRSTVKLLANCFKNYNLKDVYPKCGVKFDAVALSFAQSTPVCMRRSRLRQNIDGLSHCQPVLAANVYVPLRTSKHPHFSSQYVVVSVKLDTRGFDTTKGADAELSGLVVFLSLLSSLAKLIDDTKVFGNTKNVLLVAFDAESWDSVGSSRMAYDISQKKFTAIGEFDERNITHWLELGPVGLFANNSYWLHEDPVVRKTHPEIGQEIDALAELIKEESSGEKLRISSVDKSLDQPLPPCSFQQILRHNILVPGLYLANHQSQFLNKFYHSYLDDAWNIGYDRENTEQYTELLSRWTSLTTIMLRTVLRLTGGDRKAIGQVKASYADVEELAQCLLVQSNCTYFRTVLPAAQQAALLGKLPFSRLSAIYPQGNPFVTTVLHYIAYNVGKRFKNDSEQCNAIDTSLLNIYAESECVVNASVFSVYTSSPYFDNPEQLTNYSSWTLSTYSSVQVEIYHSLPSSTSITYIVLGTIVTFLCVATVFWVRMKTAFFLCVIN